MSQSWKSVKHSWSEIGIYSGDRRIAVVEIGSDVTEETQDIAERQMSLIAALIVAAPDMFVALESALNAIDAFWPNDPPENQMEASEDQAIAKVRKMIRAAIAKAQGDVQ